METMNSQQKPGDMAKFRNRKGFSLIEMAIVLVIIGIIIAAIVKGQDLIMNANAKKAVATTEQWRNLGMAFYDRNGRMPGDVDKSGIIGDGVADQTAAASGIGEIAAIMEQAPANPLQIGSVSLWYYFGYALTATSGPRNALVICGVANCGTALTLDQVELIKAIDTAEDAVADGGLGQFRAFTAAPALSPAAPGVVNLRSAAAVMSLAPTTASVVGSTLPWSTTYLGAVWLFDRPF